MFSAAGPEAEKGSWSVGDGWLNELCLPPRAYYPENLASLGSTESFRELLETVLP